MTDTGGEIHPDTIADIGHRVRKNYSHPRGICIDVAGDFIHQLPDSVDARAVYCHVDGERNELHYLVAIPTTDVVGHKPSPDTTQEPHVFVDLSLDQFCDELAADGRVAVSYGPRDEIPEVIVLPPGDSRRDRYEDVELLDPAHVLNAR